MGDIRLRVGERDFSKWMEISVTRSLQHMTGEFSATASGIWSVDGGLRPKLLGQPFKVLIGDELTLSGFIDATPPEYDANNHVIRIEGRDRTADLCDSSAKSVQWIGRSLAQVATDLCRPFGIKVIDRAHANTPFRSFKPHLGSTGFNALAQGARYRGVMLMSSAAGDLIITRAGTERAADTLELGKNVVVARGQSSLRDTYTHYQVHGQSRGADQIGRRSRVMAEAQDHDFTPGRYRPYIVLAEGPIGESAARTRAEWERAWRRGRSQAVTYTVRGWRQSNGKLWEPNVLVPVKDAYLELDELRLITDVVFTQGTNGERTDITVMPRDAFAQIAESEPEFD